MLCLSGTPFQNRLADVQSLISLLKIWPWNQDWIWRQHLIPGMTVGDRHAVQTLNRMMQIVCLRRTKQAILNLPRKIEKAIVVSMEERWERFSKDLHDEFIHLFGRLQMAGEPWNPAEFFKQLTMIWQYCNHPMFAREVIPNNQKWRWQDSGKLVHLVQHLKGVMGNPCARWQPKAVIFSSYVQFLEMYV